MSAVQRLLVTCFSVASIYAAPALAESCKPDQIWSHKHAAAKPETISDDIKGSRATRIEVCRDMVDSGANLKVTTHFEGNREPTLLAQGKCKHKLAKWAIVRSVGAQTDSNTPAEAKGVYRICKE